TLNFTSNAQTRVNDIFGRPLNQHGITLVDWDGYLANPLIKIYLLPPIGAALPGSATLTANGARLYFDTPSSVSSNGPSKTVSLPLADVGVPVRIGIFPDRDSLSKHQAGPPLRTGGGIRAAPVLGIHSAGLAHY